MKNIRKTESYHGTTVVASQNIVKGAIDVSMGGGELGQGFYTGTYIWEAKSWARMKHNSNAVVEISVSENIFYQLNIELLDYIQTTSLRNSIRCNNSTRTHLE